MDPQTITIILVIMVALVAVLVWRVNVLSRRVEDLKFMKKSREVHHGKSWEHFAPFMDHYPYDPENFRFLGSPVDGISFEDDKVVFIEFKTGTSALSERQRKIRSQVQSGRVAWDEVRG